MRLLDVFINDRAQHHTNSPLKTLVGLFVAPFGDYVQRVGDTYNYLTNEEQDIEQEIKNTDIDSTKEIDELKKILVSDVLGKMTVAYGEQRAQFRYGLHIDGVQQSAQQPIWLNVVTSTNAQDRADAIRMGMGMRDTITLLLDMSDKNIA